MRFSSALNLVPLLHSRQDFSNYNPCAQNCLRTFIPSTGCKISLGTLTNVVATTHLNLCLCSDANSLDSVAKCTFSSCGATNLQNTALTSMNNCAKTGTPTVYSVQQFIDAGNPAVSKTPAAPSTTPPSKPTSTVKERGQSSSTMPVAPAAQTTKPPTENGINVSINGQGGAIGGSGNGGNGGTNSICVNCKNAGGISQNDRIAIGTSLGMGLPAKVIGIWGLWCLRKRRNKRQKTSSIDVDLERNSNEVIGHGDFGLELDGRPRQLAELIGIV